MSNPFTIEDDPSYDIFTKNGNYHVIYQILGHGIRCSAQSPSFGIQSGGFELYEGMTEDYMNKGVDNKIRVLIRRKLEVREVLNGLIACYDEYVSNYPEEQREAGYNTLTCLLLAQFGGQ